MPGGHLGTIWASVALDTAPLGAGAARARREMYALDATMSKSTRGLGKAFLGAGVSATIMAGVVAAASVKMASDFDTEIAKAGAVAEASQAQMKEWGDTILKETREFPQSAKEMASALYWIKSDMPDATDVQQFETLRIAAMGATGGVAELEDATEALIVVQNAYSGSAAALEEPIDYMDAMNVAVQRGSITLQDFVGNMHKVIGTAALANVPFTEIAAAVATLTRKGVPAETAFMALNQALVTFLKPSEQAKEAASKLGITFDLNTLKTKGLAGSLMMIADAIGEDDSEFAQLFPNIRALKAVLPLAGVSVEDFKNDLQAMGDMAGTTQGMWDIMSEAPAAKFATAMNNMRESLIRLGQELMPTAINLAEALGRIFEGKNEAVNTFAGVIKMAGKALWDLASAVIAIKPLIYSLAAAFLLFKIGNWATKIGLAGEAITSTFTILRMGLAQVGTHLGYFGSKLVAEGSIMNSVFVGTKTASLSAATGIGAYATSIATVAAITLPAVIATAAFVIGMKNADQAAEKAWNSIREGDRTMTQAGLSLSELTGKYQDLRTKLSQMTPDQEGYAETASQMKQAANEVAASFPELVSGFDSEGNAILKADEALKSHINSLLQYSNIIKVRETGGVGVLGNMLGAIPELERQRDVISSSIDDIMASLEGLNMAGFNAAGALNLLNTDFEAGAEYIKAYIRHARDVGLVQQQMFKGGPGIKDPQEEFRSIEAALKKLGLTIQGSGGSVAYLNGEIGKLKFQASQAKTQLIETAKAAGMKGLAEPVDLNILRASLQGITAEYRQFGTNAIAAYAEGSLAAQGLIGPQYTQMAQGIANLISAGADWDGTGGEIGKRIYDSIKQQVIDAGITVKPKIVVVEQDTNMFKTLQDDIASIFSGNVPTITVPTAAEVQTKANTDGAANDIKNMGASTVVATTADISGAQKALDEWDAVKDVKLVASVNPTGLTFEQAAEYIDNVLSATKPTMDVHLSFTWGEAADILKDLGDAFEKSKKQFGDLLEEMDTEKVKELTDAIGNLTNINWGLLQTWEDEGKAWEKRQKQLELDILLAKQSGDQAKVDAAEKAKQAEEDAHRLNLLQKEIAIMEQGNKTNDKAVKKWEALQNAYEKSAASLEAYEKKIKSVEETIRKLNDRLEESRHRAELAQRVIDKYSNIRITGEVTAESRAFAIEQKLNKLELERLKIEQKIAAGKASEADYARLAAIEKSKEKLERQKQIIEMQAKITFDPLRRSLEKLQDPLKFQETSYRNIYKKLKEAESALRDENKIQQSINDKLYVENRKLDELRLKYDSIKESVDRFKQRMDNLGAYMIGKWQEILNNMSQLGGVPQYQHGTDYVPVTGLAMVHQGERIIAANRNSPRMTSFELSLGDSVITSPVHLDGKVLTNVVTKIQGQRIKAYSMSGGRY